MYLLNEERFNKQAVNKDGEIVNGLISLGYGNFIKLHDEDWVTIINVNDVDYSKTSIRMHKSIFIDNAVNGASK